MMLTPLLALLVAPQVAPVEAVLQAEIGAPDGDPEEAFQHVSDLAADADGNVYVLDQLGNRVRVFSPAGDHLRTFGRAGRAPGELNRPIHIDVRSDAVTVLNPSSQVNHYDLSGRLLTSEQLPFGAQDVARIGEGRYVVLTEGSIARDDPAPVMALLFTGPGVVDTVLTVPSSDIFYRAPSATSSIGTSLCWPVHFVVNTEELWIASGMDGSLGEWRLTNAGPERSRASSVAPQGDPLPDSLRTRMLDQLPSQIDLQSDGLYVPSVLSSICGLEQSPDGTLWVRLGNVDGRERWRAIDGATLGSMRELTVSEGVAIKAFSGDLAYGVRVGEPRITRVMVYRIE